MRLWINKEISSEECEKLILNKEPRLWERKIEDQDFLVVRLGTGDVPLDIKVNYPKETFSMEDDNLVEILNTIAEKSKILEEAPIIVSLAQKNISSIIVDKTISYTFPNPPTLCPLPH